MGRGILGFHRKTRGAQPRFGLERLDAKQSFAAVRSQAELGNEDLRLGRARS